MCLKQGMRLLAFLFSASLFAQSEVVVQIYNNAGVPAGQLKQAVQIADRIFAPAGIVLRWHLCVPACPEPSSAAAYIVGLAGAQMEMPTPAALGFAMLTNGRGNRAAISLPRVEYFAEAHNIPAATALAYSIIHELGHLITRSKRHSHGVMTAQWSKEDAVRIGQSRLAFTLADVQAMKGALQALFANQKTRE